MFASKSLIQQSKTRFRPVCHPKSVKQVGRNLIMLFLTIMFGFGSVIVLANITVQTNISNAVQTIKEIVITQDGTDSATRYINMSGGIYINPAIVTSQTSYGGDVLGLDTNGSVIRVAATALTISGGIGGDDGDWTIDGTNTNIYRTTGRVGVGDTPDTMSADKFYVVASGVTELLLQENNPGNAANMHFKNTVNTRLVGGYSNHFYIGMLANSFLSITTGGNIGIGTDVPDQKFVIEENDQKIASFIIPATAAGRTMQSNKTLYSGLIIAQGNAGIGGLWNQDNELELGAGLYASVYITTGNRIGMGVGNNNPKATLQVSGSFIAGNYSNTIISGINSNAIVGGTNNTIVNSDNALIGGTSNLISGATNSAVLGVRTLLTSKNYTFARNGDEMNDFIPYNSNAFLINAPLGGGANGGVGINVTDPKTELDIEGRIRVRPHIDTFACSAALKGSIYYNSDTDHFYGCTNVGWTQLDN